MSRASRVGFGGLVVLAVGFLSATGRLPRNLFAGIRLPSTMRSDEAWRAGHQAAGPALAVAGLGPITVAAIVAARGRARDGDAALLRVGTGWLLAWLGLATVQASRAARAAARDTSSQDPPS